MMLLMLIIILDDDDDGIVSVCLSASLIDDHTKSFGYHTKSNSIGAHLCSLCDPANKIGRRKVRTCQFGSA
jgi:hypothetical protein